MNSEGDADNDHITRNRKTKDKPPLWDSFQDPPSKRATGSAANWTKLSIFLKLFKLFTYVLVFVIILLTAVASKLAFIFMVAHVNPNTTIKYCNIIDLDGGYSVTLPIREQIVWIWSLIFAFSAPEVFTFLRSLRICIFKDVKSPTWPEVALVTSFELFHVIGLGILVFFVFPHLDSMKALLLCNSVCFVPALLNILLGAHSHWKSLMAYVISILALTAQASAFVLWPAINDALEVQILAIPLILISFRWWENYINSYSSIANLIKLVRRTRSRYHTYLYLSPIKMLVFALIAFCFHGQPVEEYFSMFAEAWNSHEILVRRIPKTNGCKQDGGYKKDKKKNSKRNSIDSFSSNCKTKETQ